VVFASFEFEHPAEFDAFALTPPALVIVTVDVVGGDSFALGVVIEGVLDLVGDSMGEKFVGVETGFTVNEIAAMQDGGDSFFGEGVVGGFEYVQAGVTVAQVGIGDAADSR